MRGNQVQGRFKVEFEHKSIDEGIVDELRDPVGTTVDWWQWDPDAFLANYEDYVDPIYDVSNQEDGKGSSWKSPFKMPVVMLQMLRGTNIPNERGFYVVDTMRLVVAVADIDRLLPGMVSNPNPHIKDRIVANNEVFFPTRVLPRGRYKDNYSVVTLDCNLCNPEELVNFKQFQEYAN